MKLAIERRESEGIIILDLKGRLTLGIEDLSLRQKLLALLEGGSRNVIVNLREVSAIDTSGLGTLVFCASKFREGGGRLVFSISTSRTRSYPTYSDSTRRSRAILTSRLQ